VIQSWLKWRHHDVVLALEPACGLWRCGHHGVTTPIACSLARLRQLGSQDDEGVYERLVRDHRMQACRLLGVVVPVTMVRWHLRRSQASWVELAFAGIGGAGILVLSCEAGGEPVLCRDAMGELPIYAQVPLSGIEVVAAVMHMHCSGLL
jgi:hypothetical protein